MSSPLQMTPDDLRTMASHIETLKSSSAQTMQTMNNEIQSIPKAHMSGAHAVAYKNLADEWHRQSVARDQAQQDMIDTLRKGANDMEEQAHQAASGFNAHH